MSKLNIDLKTI